MKILIFLALFLLTHSSVYRKIVHESDPQAKCLDGSPPALYIHQGSQKDKILVFLFGGGFCQGQTLSQAIEQCYKRSKTMLGSSTLWPDQYSGQGYLSTDPAISTFANWTKAVLIYCDGALHQGHRQNPLNYKGTNLYFRGQKIIRSQLKYLDINYNLSKASQLVWTGGSAGAIGAYIWANEVIKYVSKDTKVHTILDSGFFLDFNAIGTHKSYLPIQLKNIYSLANLNGKTPNEACNNYYPKEEWKCFLYEYSYASVEGRKLIINSEYDAWAIPNIQKIKCLKIGKTGNQILSGCSSSQKKAIEDYRKRYLSVTEAMLQIENNSFWTIACSSHVYACINLFYDSAFEKVPGLVGLTVRNAIEQFVEGKRVLSVDIQEWPANQPCSI